MRVSQLGERKLVQIASEVFLKNGLCKGTALSIGDDAAGISFDETIEKKTGNLILLVSSDMCYSDTHFPEGSPPFLCGWYSAAVNLSDIAAMGGRAVSMILDIGLPEDYPVDYFREVLEGFNECCRYYGVQVIGGDTKYTPSLLLAATVLGSVDEKNMLRRKGCRSGDSLYVTGKIGSSITALFGINKYIYRRRKDTVGADGSETNPKKYYWKVDVNDPEHIDYETLLKVKPCLDTGIKLAATGKVTSCMDNSDGLAVTLHTLSKENQIGFRIFAENIPLNNKCGKNLQDMMVSDHDSSFMWKAVYSGGDFGLVFTASSTAEAEESFRRLILNGEIIRIGEVTDDDILIEKDGELKSIENRGWEHLKN